MGGGWWVAGESPGVRVRTQGVDARRSGYEWRARGESLVLVLGSSQNPTELRVPRPIIRLVSGFHDNFSPFPPLFPVHAPQRLTSCLHVRIGSR